MQTSATTASGSIGSTSETEETTADETTGTSNTSASASQPRLDVAMLETESSPIESESDGVCGENIDIVFVMDVSTTMGPFLDTMADEILAVDEAVAALDISSEPHYGLVVFVDDVALLQAGAPYASAAALAADFQMWSDFTSTNGQVTGGGSNSTWPENSLDGLYAAGTGFQWRPAADTLRVIIHTTDDTFWDGPTTQNGVMIDHGYDETVALLQTETIRVFSFADDIGGSCECDDVTPGWSTPYMGKTPIPQATDGGVFDIAEVLSGQLSLSVAIGDAVGDTVCDDYEPVG